MSIHDKINELTEFEKYQLYYEAKKYELTGITGDTLLRKLAEEINSRQIILTMMSIVNVIYRYYADKYMQED